MFLKDEIAIVQALIMCCLYAAQLTLGYFSMLVAMTYQVELFVCIVAGLATGHGLFSFKPYVKPVSVGGKNNNYTAEDKGFVTATSVLHGTGDDMVDPCCAYLHMDDDQEPDQQKRTVR